MKHLRCAKCEHNQRQAGEALALFNEASGALLDAEQALADMVTHYAKWGYLPDSLLERARSLVAQAGERSHARAAVVAAL